MRTVSSTCRIWLWWVVRNRTACRRRSTPASMRSSTASATASACACSSWEVTRRGRRPEGRSARRSFTWRSVASAITALAVASTSGVERWFRVSRATSAPKRGREVEDGAHVGRPEAVDGLRVVADRGEGGAQPGQLLHEVGLQRVGVLDLVDEHVVDLVAEQAADGGRAEQGPPLEEEVVVVEHLVAPLALEVRAEDGPQLIGIVPAPRVPALEHLLERPAGVHAAAPDGRHRVLAGVAAGRGAGRPQLVPQQREEVAGIGRVEHGERRLEADGPAVAAQEPVGDGMEGAGPAGGGHRLAGGHLGAGDELGGGPAGEGEQNDPLGGDARCHEVGQAGAEGGGLARARPGHDQQVAVGVARRERLLVGERRRDEPVPRTCVRGYSKQGQLGLGLQAQRGGVHAEALTGRPRAVGEHVAQVGVATPAAHLGAGHPVARVGDVPHGVGLTRGR